MKEDKKSKTHPSSVYSPATCSVVIFAIGLNGRRRVMVVVFSWRVLHTIGLFGHPPCTFRALT